MTVDQAIHTANAILPGQAVADGLDPRWQAIIGVGEFMHESPETIWSFISRWGRSPDPDIRAAIATCLLEHLLEYHFSAFFPRVEREALADRLFAQCFSHCWPMGQAESIANRPAFDALKQAVAAV